MLILRNKHTQQGLVLFVALMALVVMSLASVALIRSVDTSSQITGNLAFKQSTSITSSYGLEAMADTIGSQLRIYATTNDPSNGYYAVCTTFDTGATGQCNGENLVAEATWTDANSKLAAGAGIADGKDPYGNTIRYIVERMCNQAGNINIDRCLMASSPTDTSSKNVVGIGTPILEPISEPLPLYRVTVRISGPKNTVTYVQAFVS
jgi:Tfp pilus assembly protein PilX